MADYRSIHTVCEAVVDLLRDNVPATLQGNSLQFEVYTAKNFTSPMKEGVSLFLYRVLPNSVQRTPAGRVNGATGRRFKSQLPVDIHFLLSVWGGTAELQHYIAGWMMRLLESTPILPSALLNRKNQVFRPDETVEITLGELDNENLFRLWETMAQNSYNLSIPYIARMVMIESIDELASGKPIQERQFHGLEHEPLTLTEPDS